MRDPDAGEECYAMDETKSSVPIDDLLEQLLAPKMLTELTESQEEYLINLLKKLKKKGGITVVKNKNNELILTRTPQKISIRQPSHVDTIRFLSGICLLVCVIHLQLFSNV
ncbi:hypothetical protein EPI10_028517 [Gossypium australe]|uniref:Uncharacterized protein n=1 Tax=Gossypium australe TaxID=47621 RepID=A0A5B6UXD4_9ROSI|nr:hypothetical protein EPI10_028517 [Gossypium australe]